MPTTRYPNSRLVGTFFGLWAAWIQFGLLRLYLEGPPTTGCYVGVPGFCWTDEDPTFSAITASLCLGFYVAGAGMSWWIPRLGSFLSGMGWLSYFVLSLMSSVPHRTREPYFTGWAPGFLFLLVPAFWHFHACVKDEPDVQHPALPS